MAIADEELNAMKRIIVILEELPQSKRERVLSYIIHRSEEWRPARVGPFDLVRGAKPEAASTCVNPTRMAELPVETPPEG